MSSSTRKQTIDGYVSELANAYNMSPMAVMQTAIFKEFLIQYREEEQGEKKCSN